jgi:hypothetical protein
MELTDLFCASFDQIDDLVDSVLDGIDPSDLLYKPTQASNSIAWMIWHLTRGQDHQVSEVAGIDQLWTSGSYVDRFALPVDRNATGYGQSAEEAAAVKVTDATLLRDYHRAVYQQTKRYLATLSASDFERIVDDSFDPPVTLGTRLNSIVADDLQHLGQAAYLRGLAES